MRRILVAALATASIGFATPASAALTVEGITYDLILNSVMGNTANFTLQISGINVAGTDTKGGRNGINAFAFNNPAGGTAVSGSSTGFNFNGGVGLNSSGCSGGGNFFCFSRTNYAFAPSPSGALSLNFLVTSDTAVNWANYSGDFKIDWAGTQNNYDLVSQVISAAPVPEPATWAMMLLGFGGIGMAMRRRPNCALMQIA